jgi:hypothetical protein
MGNGVRPLANLRGTMAYFSSHRFFHVRSKFLIMLVLASQIGCGRGEPAVHTVGGRSLPNGPLVVNGSTGGKSSSDGTELFTLNGGLEVVQASDPILSIVHVKIIPAPSVKSESMDSTPGNTPDKFFWNGDFNIKLDGQAGTLSLNLDGRAHTFHAGGRSFDLAKGNFFRVTMMPGWQLVVEQFPVVDVLEYDPSKIEARFAVFDSEQKKGK